MNTITVSNVAVVATPLDKGTLFVLPGEVVDHVRQREWCENIFVSTACHTLLVEEIIAGGATLDAQAYVVYDLQQAAGYLV